MIVEPLAIAGAWRIRPAPQEDARGSFARLFCEEAFAAAGLPARFEQVSLARNTRAGTLRGLHYQDPPFAESKLVRCVRGVVFDVVVDLRAGSATHGQWLGEILDAEGGVALLVGKGLAHGYQTLADDTDMLYQITPAFRPGHGRGVRWDDPAFAIRWPLADPILSPRDAAWPDWQG